MKIAVMQPYFFPYIGYFQVIHAVDTYILHGALNYRKKGWVNRNRILGPKGSPIYVNAEIRDSSSHRTINNVELVDADRWRKKFLLGVFHNYRKSPHFDEAYGLIEKAVSGQTAYLSALNKQCIRSICACLGILTRIESNEEKYSSLEERLADADGDVRSEFPGLRLSQYDRKVIRILEICRQENADVFVNAIGGRALYDKAEFSNNGVNLCFVETQPFTYPQRAPAFVPDLSIIDVLMNCGKEGTRELLAKYRLV